MKLYRCRRGCHAANQSKRCPVCGDWLLFAGEMHPQEAHDMILREQRERAQATGMADWKPKTDSNTRRMKEEAKKEEAKHFHQLNKNRRDIDPGNKGPTYFYK